MTRFPETDKDVENVEAWAQIIAHLLYHVPGDKRGEVLALASKNEEAESRKREAHNGLLVLDASDDWMNSPGMRHWNAVMRLKSLVIQIFVRNITNNHSPQDAASILLADHPHGTGSGRLQDYLPDQNDLIATEA